VRNRCLRSCSRAQYNTTCWGVSGPRPHEHCLDRIPGTFLSNRKLVNPIFSVRTCIRIELSAFRSDLCRLRIRLVGGVSLGIILLLAGSLPSLRPTLLLWASQRSFQSYRILGFSSSFQRLIDPSIHFSTHAFRSWPGVGVGGGGFRIIARIASHALRIS
jgi:hypothetical protein